MKKQFIRGFIITTMLACAAPALADEACVKSEACAAGEVKLPFMQALQQQNAEAAAPATLEAATKKKTPPRSGPVKTAPAAVQAKLQLFYTYDCPHCRQAMGWLPELQKDYPELIVEKYEVKRSAENRKLFAAGLAERGARLTGFPTFFIGNTVLTGFSPAHTPAEIKTALAETYGCACPGKKEISVPVLGKVDPATVSLLRFSLLLGLLDGLNPCAMWVLMFLMGLLVYTRSTKKMLLIGGVFTAASAIVYFAFMAAWFNLFTVIGQAGWITGLLGAVAVVMGLVNLKEIFFFKQGVSLMIADADKQKLAAKIRAIMSANETPAMLAGTVLLAFFVNLIELGCTIGLPAIFTRVLSIREAGPALKYSYMAVYNIAYIIPLAAIVALFVLTMGRYKMTEAHGKVLKGVSGALMLALGLLMLLRPEALMFN